MERDDIIRMAREAGLNDYLWLDDKPLDGIGAMYQTTDEKVVQRFAALVAAHEREACVSIITREAQAYSEPVWAVEIVNDIRARGET